MSRTVKRNYALLILGMACYWPMFRNNYFGLLFSENAVLIENGNYFYLALLLLLALTGLFAQWRSSQVTQILNRRWIIPFVSFLASSTTIAILLVPSESSFAIFATTLFVIALVLYIMAATMAWGMLLVATDFNRVMFWLALSFFISFLLSLTSRLPGNWALILPILGPLVSGLSWYFIPTGSGDFKPFTRLLFKQPIMRTVLVLILFLLIGGIVRGFFDLGVLGFVPGRELSPRPFFSIFFSLALAVTAYYSKHHERLINILWIVFVLIFFTGLFITAAFSASWWSIGTDIVVMSRTFLVFFLWIELINTGLRLQQSPLFLFGVFFIPTDCLSGILTNYLVPRFSIQADELPWEFTGVFALAMALILLFGSFVYLSSLAFKHNTSAEEQGNHTEDKRREVCSNIAEEHKLTAREGEILFYVSQGHGIKRIAETLYISVSTAQTHAKSLYRKLGLHSRQEIIDLVADRLTPKS